MKKILFLLFLCSFLVLSLASCSLFDGGHEKPTVLGQESDELIATLIEHLEFLTYDVGFFSASLGFNIGRIKGGTQPLLVEFDSSPCYYVCGYYIGAHEDENFDFCCAADYLWLRYEKAKDIREKYLGRTCIVTFQMSLASAVTDIRSESAAVSAFEHFAQVEPAFKGGYNTESFTDFSPVFIYLNSSDNDKVYYTTTYRSNSILYCVKLENKIFIRTPIYLLRSNGERYNYDLKQEFGNYYDALMNIMVTGRYSTSSGKDTICYGLFSLEDFADILK